jgi:hypothetical protein
VCSPNIMAVACGLSALSDGVRAGMFAPIRGNAIFELICHS